MRVLGIDPGLRNLGWGVIDVSGARLTHVCQNRPDLRFPFPDDFVQRLEGATVQRIERRAKYLLMPLSTGETWVTHLGMTGRFTLDGTQLGEFEEPAPIWMIKITAFIWKILSFMIRKAC